MNVIFRRVMWLAAPLVLFAAIWGLNWRHSHPDTSALDTRCRSILLAADRVTATVEPETPPNIEDTTISQSGPHFKLQPDAMLGMVTDLHVTHHYHTCATCGAGGHPALDFDFYTAGRVVGGFHISDHQYTYCDMLSSPAWTLHPSSVRRLREFIRQHPDIQRAALNAGVGF